MSIKVTNKEIKDTFRDVIAVGYCDAQNLLRAFDKIGHNSGVYGWNYDLYTIDGAAIVTGYRNTPGQGANREILREYEKRAADAWRAGGSYDERLDAVRALAVEYVRAELKARREC